MISNVTIKQPAWVMKDNAPTQVFIAEIKTTENASGVVIIYGVHFKEQEVGKTAPSTYYSPESLFESKEALRTAVFGS